MAIVRRFRAMRRLASSRSAMPPACFVSAVRIAADRVVAREMRPL
ncbi:MAG: hypothetical protein ACT4QF_01925 [Sporichthyaceae bacterium]